MNFLKLSNITFLTLAFAVAACDNSATVQSKSSSQGSSNSPAVSNSGTFEGTWKEEGALGDYLYLGTSKGYFCSSDIKSDAAVSVKGNTLGASAHLGEQKMVLKENGTILLVLGEDKGTEYEIRYKKTQDTLPKRCADEISRL